MEGLDADLLKLAMLRDRLFDTQGDWVELSVAEWLEIDRWMSNVWATAPKPIEGASVTFDDRQQCLVKRMYRYCQDRRRGGDGYRKAAQHRQGIGTRMKRALPFLDCHASLLLVFRFHGTTGEPLGVSIKSRLPHNHTLDLSDSRGNSAGVRAISRHLMSTLAGNIPHVEHVLHNRYSEVGGSFVTKHSIRSSGREGVEDRTRWTIPSLTPGEMQRLANLPYVPPHTADRPPASAPTTTSTRTQSTFQHRSPPPPVAARPRPQPQNMSLASLLYNLDSAKVPDNT